MPSTDLVLRSQSDVPENFADQMRMAQAVAASGLLPAHLRDKPANVLVILAGARALGISWFWATQSLYVVEGKLSYSAELMRALVIRAGHKFRILEHTAEKAKVEIIRSDDPDFAFSAEFTMADAKKAGLAEKSVWKKFPTAMLLARATAMAVRGYCPDVLFGVVYTPEELGARVDESGEPEVSETGAIILDSEVVSEVVVPQEIIDRAGADIWRNYDLKASAATFVACGKEGYLDMVPNMEGVEGDALTLKELWVKRLVEAIPNADKELCGSLWQVAKGTGVLEEQAAGGGQAISVAIQGRVAAIKQREAALARMKEKNEAAMAKLPDESEEEVAANPLAVLEAEVIADVTTT